VFKVGRFPDTGMTAGQYRVAHSEAGRP